EGRDLHRRRETALHTKEARQKEIDELRARISALPQLAVSPAIRRALEAAVAAGDIPGNMEALARRIQQEEAELVQRLCALRQPEFPCELGVDGERKVDAAKLQSALASLERMQPWPSDALTEEVR